MKGKANHPMEDYHVAKFARVDGHELGLFAIYDGHLGSAIPAYLQKHLFANILNEVTCAKPLGPFSIYIVFYFKKLRHFWLKYHACIGYIRASFGLIQVDASRKHMRKLIKIFSKVLTWAEEVQLQ